MNDDDLKARWKNQPADAMTVPIETLRAGATRFQRRVARRNAVEYFACTVVIACFGMYMATFRFPLMEAGSVLIILATILVAWQLRVRGASASLPADLGQRSWLDFHRAQLERQRDALHSVWLWYVAPFVPGVVVFRWGVETELGAGAPFARGLWANVSIAVVFVVVIAINRYAAKRCQRELDALGRSAGYDIV
jgi:hypothetical protein